MITNKTALFPGRFQPPSIAHAHTLEIIRRRWSNVIIIITHIGDEELSGYPKEWQEFVRMSDFNFRPEKNQFTPEEVAEMWQAYIDANELQTSVSCKINVRPHLDPNFNVKFPPSETVIVYPKAGSTETAYDLMREQTIGQILDRHIEFVRPGFMLHNTEVRLRVAAGESWECFMSPEIYETFLRLRGPERIVALRGQ